MKIIAEGSVGGTTDVVDVSAEELLSAEELETAAFYLTEINRDEVFQQMAEVV